MINYKAGFKDWTWHVGELKEDHCSNIPFILELQADCDELDLILKSITGIPKSNHLVQRWYGDHAKFIAYVVFGHKLIIK